ncbi:MAG: hypothetical protein EXR75_01570 [Myxococcales bacterium]|nr:hypothetical protein [Myxococcales bacterium]
MIGARIGGSGIEPGERLLDQVSRRRVISSRVFDEPSCLHRVVTQVAARVTAGDVFAQLVRSGAVDERLHLLYDAFT